MPIASSTSTMSSTQGSISPAPQEVEEPRKKGARGGKRSVTHLSKAQLARKRANDREAQRNIRQRTKEHIENLERKVKELEGGGRSSSMERVLRRNQELEGVVERLKEQLAQRMMTMPPVHPIGIQQVGVQQPTGISEELLMPRKAKSGWMVETESSSPPWPTADVPSHIPNMISIESPVTNRTFSVDSQVFSSASTSFDDSEDPQQLYTPATPVWDDVMVFGPKSTQSLTKPAPAWTPFHPTVSQPPRFAELPSSGFAEVTPAPGYPQQNNTTCWQSQPSVYAWQISTKLKAPVTHVDHLMINTSLDPNSHP